MVELVKKLSNCFGPAGHEERVKELITEELAPHTDGINTDILGNLIAVKKGQHSDKRLMIAAHMDEIGLMITHIAEEGFLRFQPLGGVNPRSLLNQTVRFQSGVMGVIACERLEKPDKIKLENLFIDIGAANADDAKNHIAIGDAACIDKCSFQQAKKVVGKALDDRVGCAVLIEALKAVSTPYSDIYAVFTVQEELGARGAKTSAYSINPNLALALDVTPCGDTPKEEPLPVKLGSGAAIKIKDQSMISHPKVKDHLIGLAEKEGIPYQLEILARGGTDAGAIHISKQGVISGAISIPTRYLHTPTELVDLDDLQACIDLTRAVMLNDLP